MPRYSVHDEILIRVHLKALEEHRKHIDSEIIVLQNRLLTLNRRKGNSGLVPTNAEKEFIQMLGSSPSASERKSLRRRPKQDARQHNGFSRRPVPE